MKEKKSDLTHLVNYYRKKAPLYDKDYEDKYWELYNDLTWHFLKPFLPKNKKSRIMDIGCGTGKWTIKLAKMGYFIDCIDISPDMLHIAEEKAAKAEVMDQIEFKQGDIRDLSQWSTDSYDLVMALGDVISYALDDQIAVQEMNRITAPGGFCVASVDSKFVYILNHIKYNQFSVLKELERSSITKFFKEHSLKTYTPEQLTALFQSCGFTNISLFGKGIFMGALPRKQREKKLTTHYQEFFELEIKYGQKYSFIGQAGHIQISAQKPI
ncbi:MAG: hypothetical protein DRO88_01350 [Promethearchaeia archaeon]|nr:MAG: hypothetical protein DRO88_01350 [Candidatus Lokiarchaeia archaeon]